MNRHAERLEHPLGVISRLSELTDGHSYAGHQAGQENRALCLRACRSRVPRNAREITSTDRHWQAIVMLELDRRPHCPQRLGNSLHRTTTETCVAFETRLERAGSNYTCEQPRRRSAVSTLKCDLRRTKSPESNAF